MARMAGKLGSALQQQHAAAAAAVVAGAAAGVSAQLPQLSSAARRDIAAAVLASARHRSLIKSALHAIVAGSSRCGVFVFIAALTFISAHSMSCMQWQYLHGSLDQQCTCRTSYCGACLKGTQTSLPCIPQSFALQAVLFVAFQYSSLHSGPTTPCLLLLFECCQCMLLPGGKPWRACCTRALSSP